MDRSGPTRFVRALTVTDDEILQAGASTPSGMPSEALSWTDRHARAPEGAWCELFAIPTTVMGARSGCHSTGCWATRCHAGHR